MSKDCPFRMRLAFALTLAASTIGLAAPQPARPAFEVASIRPGGELGPPQLPIPGAGGRAGAVGLMIGGPGTDDPGRARVRYATPRSLIRDAYGIKDYQLVAAGALDSRWDIDASVPPGARAEDLPLMLQTLLADRFHLVVRIQEKEFTGYNLVVAKGGLKLSDSVDTRSRTGKDGIAVHGAPTELTQIGSTSQPDGSRILHGNPSTMAALANVLENWVGGAPVTDKTGLTQKYDLKLAFTPADNTNTNSAAPVIFTALETEFGLKLESVKVLLKAVAVEHIDAAPTAN